MISQRNTCELVNLYSFQRIATAMPTAKSKLKSASVNASPLKRRRMSHTGSAGFPMNAAVVAMGFKNSGNVRRILSQYSVLEAEVNNINFLY